MINHKIPNQDLIDVFTDTFNKSYNIRPGETTKHTFDEVKGSYLSYIKENSNITVENSDTVSALEKLFETDKGYSCILNMASYKRPGGGVERGAKAQEECLFRCSNLSHSISTDFYPLEDDSCLYTQGAVFFKDKDYNYIDPIDCDVMTIAAINLNSEHHFYKDQNKVSSYEETTLNKIRLMLTIPAKHDVKNIVLGAWGCGVFKNDPTKMANFFKQVLIDEGYDSLYDNIVFAIINDHNSVGSNYEIFSEIFNKK